MVRLIIVVLACFTSAFAQVPGFGGCPSSNTVANFDIDRYLGKWYEVYKLPNLFQKGQTCVTANYSIKADGHIKVYNQGFSNGKTVFAEGDAYIPDKADASKLSLRFTNAAPYGHYWVLDTDYTTYTVVFSCESLGGLAHIEFAWILTRNNTISDSLKQKVFQIFEKNGVPTKSLTKTTQDCGKDV
ncbi:apolipoprotein D-like [Patella vulgata]|uniref:apolipoprotein D-like n=1 Tax=Patella vulgata TaxID=6465 RepID=UPI0021804B78|nr:apolipoprotein D-like [Patella vulgata]